MVLGRLWGFAKRHRKKLLFTAACAGGAYYAWRVWLPRVQQQLLEKLLRDSLEFARSEDEEKRRDQEKRAGFAHKQQVSDSFLRRALVGLQARHRELFSVEELFEKVKGAASKEARLEAFQELQLECVARLVSALHALESALLLYRVEFNIAGRELAGAPEPAGDAQAAAFLETTRFLREEGLRQIASASRAASKSRVQSAGLSPTAPVSAQVLETLLAGISGDVEVELLQQGRVVALLLPEGADAELPEEHRARVKPLVDEARDYLESPQFLAAMRAVSKGAVARLAAAFGDGAADPAAAPLSSGQSVPMAKLNGQFIEISQSLLDEGGDFLAGLADEPALEEFCQSIYFQDAPGK